MCPPLHVPGGAGGSHHAVIGIDHSHQRSAHEGPTHQHDSLTRSVDREIDHEVGSLPRSQDHVVHPHRLGQEAAVAPDDAERRAVAQGEVIGPGIRAVVHAQQVLSGLDGELRKHRAVDQNDVSEHAAPTGVGALVDESARAQNLGVEAPVLDHDGDVERPGGQLLLRLQGPTDGIGEDEDPGQAPVHLFPRRAVGVRMEPERCCGLIHREAVLAADTAGDRIRRSAIF
jgi:hypothetical protein